MEVERGGGGGGAEEEEGEGLAVHNRPRHECSSTFVSTHPLQFQLSNRTSDSQHPLTLCTKKACAHTHTCRITGTHMNRNTHIYLRTCAAHRHTNITAYAQTEGDTCAHKTHTHTNARAGSLNPHTHT